MQSKTSSFNVGIFKSNLKRFWPIMATLFLLFFVFLPFELGSEWTFNRSYYDTEPANALYFVPEQLSYLNVPAFAFIFAGIAVLLVFGYLFSTRSIYMMKSFPVERKTWIFTNVASVLFLQIVPVLLNVIIAMIFCLCNGLGNLSYLWFFLAQNICYFLIFDGIAMVSVFISGNYLGAIGSYVVLNYIAYMAVTFLYSLESIFLLGYSPDNLIVNSRENALSPSLYLSSGHIRIVLTYEDGLTIPTVSVEGIPALILYSLAGIALIAVCLVISKKRKTETAGDLISFEWVKRALQIIVSAFTSVVISQLIISSFMERFVISYAEAFVSMLFCVVFWGAIGYYAFEMFARKTLRVFNRQQFKRFAIYTAGMLALMIIVKCDPTGFEKAVPNADEVEWAGFCFDRSYTYATYDAQDIVEIQKLFVDNGKALKTAKSGGDSYADSVTFKFKKKDGSYFFRRYYIADVNECKALYDTFCSVVKEPERMKEGMINPNWEEMSPVTVEYYKEVPLNEGMEITWESLWEELTLSQSEVEELYLAVLEDVDEGNVNPLYTYDSDTTYVNQLNFNLRSSNSAKSCDEIYNEYLYDEILRNRMVQDTYFNVTLEPKMRNTIQCLIKLGVIESENDLILQSEIYGE